MDLLAYNELQHLLVRLGISQDASEFHGALCGMLCHGAPQPDALIFDQIKSDAEAQGQLELFIRSTSGNLCLPEFMPVLPEDEQTLKQRVDALAAWCGGFLYGLGTSQNLDIRQLSEESQELIRDFTEISRADVEASDDNDPEDEENAYAELIEYIRVGAQVIFLELQPSTGASAEEVMPDKHILH